MERCAPRLNISRKWLYIQTEKGGSAYLPIAVFAIRSE